MAISNSASPEIIWGLGGPEEDHQLHHCCWTGRVGEQEEEEEEEEDQLANWVYSGVPINNKHLFSKLLRVTTIRNHELRNIHS